MRENFLQIVREHMKRYPVMEPQDYGKLVFQGEFGPEHMITDRQQAESFLIDEWKTLPKNYVGDILEFDKLYGRKPAGNVL